MKSIPRIVIDGGPCAGKTTALSRIPQRLRDYGHTVLCVPEVATEFFTHGVTVGKNGIDIVSLERQMLLTQIEREERYLEIAQRIATQKIVLVCDRGRMSPKAYIDSGDFAQIIAELGYSETQLRDEPYEGVFHLVTAAEGAEEFYTTWDNKARTETPEQARDLDRRTLEAWIGHSHLKVIDNGTDFEGKIRKLLASICRVIGIPTPLEIERKFLINPISINTIPTAVVAVNIEQTYLHSWNNLTRRIRRRTQNGYSIYYQTYKRNIKPGVRDERERQISARTYHELFTEEKDPDLDVIVKRRHCFVWKGQYFELDVFIEPQRLAGLHILEIELTEENDRVTIPPFINVINDVTSDERFSNHSLAHKTSQIVV